jgi:pilus assembly protein Flp/PilA
MQDKLSQLASKLATQVRGEAGQSMAEYGILLAVIAVVVVAVAVLLGGSISSLFSSLAGSL